MNVLPAFPCLTSSLTLPAVVILLLSCALSMLLGSVPAHAQGSVSGVTVTSAVPMVNGVPTVTVKVGTPVTFMATATAGTATPDTYWTVKSGPTYLWQDYEVEAPPYAPTTTFSKTYNTPGTYTMQMRCQVSYVVQYARGGTAGIQQIGSQDVTINVIGGPISGENNIYWFCDSSASTDWGHLSATGGQPAGTTYSWSMAGNAQLTSSSTAANVTYCGSGAGSMKPGDVKAAVTYSLNGVTATSDPFPITVHAPATFTIDPNSKVSPVMVIPPATDYYGFTGQSIRFQVLDSIGLPFPPNKAYWSESWVQPQSGGGQPAHVGGGPLDAQGYSVDNFSLTSLSEPNDPNGDKIWGPLTHTYSVTDTGGTGGLVGCPVQVYADVYYYTYGVKGNGF